VSQEFSAVGKRIAQRDGPAKATGAAQYAGDMEMPGMLIGKVLRSPHPHARVKRVDKSEAERLPGVEIVLAPEDIALWNGYDRGFKDIPMMPGGYVQEASEHILTDRARHFGDAVAAVAAVNDHVAEEALDLIKVDYEVLPFVLDPEEAMKPGAPRVQDSAERNVGRHMHYPLKEGDVEKGFAESDCLVEGTFQTTKQAHCTMETAAAVAYLDPGGRLKIWSQCQLAHLARRELAHIFNMPVARVEMLNPCVGGSFGQRSSICAEQICAALALKTGKPVKLVFSREEAFTALETRSAYKYDLKMGFKKDGTLHAMKIYMLGHAGGYLARAPMSSVIAMVLGMGHYRCPNRAGEADMVLTHTAMGGACRGFGNEVIIWGIEQLMDEAAEKLGMDPMEIRLKNMKEAGDTANMGLILESSYLKDCIEQGAETIGWHEKRKERKKGKIRRGVGMATMTHCSGATPFYLEHSSAFLKFNEDGSASLIVHPGAAGTGIWGSLAQIAAEELGIGVEDINIVTGDTDITMFEMGSHASRSTYVIGNAVLHAARQAKTQILERAAKLLGAEPEALEIREKRVYVKTAPEKSLTIAQICHNAIFNFEEDCLTLSGKCSWESKWNSPPLTAYFAEVEVDIETGRVRLLQLVCAVDCGRAINPMTVEGQMEGGAQQGIGYGLTENYIINKDTGVVETDNFDTYKMPGVLDMPETKIIIIDKPDPVGPFGAKGVGEPGMVGVAPAIANAVYDATGVRIRDLPITPEKILKGLGALQE
jgi:xanthine dehydrogenase molybdenum-binding subunit